MLRNCDVEPPPHRRRAIGRIDDVEAVEHVSSLASTEGLEHCGDSPQCLGASICGRTALCAHRLRALATRVLHAGTLSHEQFELIRRTLIG